jgi:hypothetical protein
MKAQSGRLGERAQPLDEVIESVLELVGRGGGGEGFAESVKVPVRVGIERVKGVVPSRGARRGGMFAEEPGELVENPSRLAYRHRGERSSVRFRRPS